MIKTTPKDFFLHIGATIALYVAAGALINLAFEIANKALPDNLSLYWNASSIIYPISLLVVLVPVLYVIEWAINRDITKISEKTSIWIRRWRIYLTLFLACATVAVDLITLIIVYLNGEITSRFIWKVLIVLVVAGSVFKYYLFTINPNMRWSGLVRKTMPWFGAILVVGTIITGFVIVGSPREQRAIRFDEQRVNDLTNIQWQIINYWQKKQALPQSLSDLNDPISNYSVPVDPETGTAYEYSIKGVMGVKGAPSGLSFELCATFSADSLSQSSNMTVRSISATPLSSPASLGMDSWAHGIGQTCFDRMIDPALYPPVKGN